MELKERITIFCKFSLGALISLIHVPLPFICDVFLASLIKDLGSHIEYYESDGDESVCGEVQPEESGARGMAEGHGEADGGSGPDEANEFVQVGKPEPDESDDEKST
jgi:hypothetical protein